jgi:thioredoxin-like negative regulator of GroEL
MPAEWRAATVGVEHDGDVSAEFDVEVTPYVFVVDDGGAVVAQGGAVNLRDVEELVTAGGGITIVRDADA